MIKEERKGHKERYQLRLSGHGIELRFKKQTKKINF